MADENLLVRLGDLETAVNILVPTPLAITVLSGQWSGSGDDYYISVNASNVTADSILIPHYDNASLAYLKGPIWCVPAAGSFTIHTSAIPTGTVNILIQFVGSMGEANYQVLADVYSTSQAVAKADVVNNLTIDDDTGTKPAGQHEVYQLNAYTRNIGLQSGANYMGNIICAGYNTGSGNYVDVFVPVNTNNRTVLSATVSAESAIFDDTGRQIFTSAPTISILETTKFGIRLEIVYESTKTPYVPASAYLISLNINCT